MYSYGDKWRGELVKTIPGVIPAWKGRRSKSKEAGEGEEIIYPTMRGQKRKCFEGDAHGGGKGGTKAEEDNFNKNEGKQIA